MPVSRKHTDLKIGIVGGLGPYAHIELERTLLQVARERFRVRREQQFPAWVVSSLPCTPDRTAAILIDGEDPTPLLLESLAVVERAGAAFALVCCNTAHHFLSRDGVRTSIPVLSMITETVAFVADNTDASEVGVLATTGTLKASLYQRAFRQRGIAASTLLDGSHKGRQMQTDLMDRAIYRLAKLEGPSACSQDEARELVVRSAKQLAESAAVDTVILGCTELSTLLDCGEIDGIRLINPLPIVASAALDIAFGRRALNGE